MGIARRRAEFPKSIVLALRGGRPVMCPGRVRRHRRRVRHLSGTSLMKRSPLATWPGRAAPALGTPQPLPTRPG
jgi:hypothetical protein